jgi:predicted HTH transcriptional regulator
MDRPDLQHGLARSTFRCWVTDHEHTEFDWSLSSFRHRLNLAQIHSPLAIRREGANALMHRDYFVSAPIRIFIFDDRVEIISPGHLTNNLTVANIKTGNSNIRNPVLTSFATKLLPYRGLGTGILRALREYPSIEFESDRDGNLFRATIRRHPR